MPLLPAPSVWKLWPHWSHAWPQVFQRPFGNDLHPLGARVVGEDAAAVHAHDAPRRLHVRVDVHALRKIEPSIRPPAQGVDDVVRVLGAESAEDDALLVGLAVAIGVLEVEQLGGLADVAGPVALGREHGRDAGGDEQAVGKDGALLGLAVVVGVFEDEDFVERVLPGRDLRIHRAARDPQAALRVPVHLRGFREERVLGPEGNFESIGER